jgi:hypothetical protein
VRVLLRPVIPRLDAARFFQAERAGGHHRRVAEQAGSLHEVRQLAHVAGPRVGEERGTRLVTEASGREVVIGARAAEEVVGEEEDVLTTLTQRREMDGDHREPVVQVGAEPTGLDGGLQVLARRRHDGDVDRIVSRRAEPAHLALVDNLEKLRLQRLGQKADLVEEDRSPVRGLEQPRLRRAGAGEGTALIAEHLGLQQRLGDRRAVHVRERPRRARPAGVDRVRDEPLAGAGLAPEEDGRRPPSARCVLEEPDDLSLDGDDRCARADQARQRLRHRVAHIGATADCESAAEDTAGSLSQTIAARMAAQCSTSAPDRTTAQFSPTTVQRPEFPAFRSGTRVAATVCARRRAVGGQGDEWEHGRQR